MHISPWLGAFETTVMCILCFVYISQNNNYNWNRFKTMIDVLLVFFCSNYIFTATMEIYLYVIII